MQDKVGKHRKSFNKLTNSIFADGISLDEERIKNISLDDFKIFNKDSFPSIQIINKRVDPSKISNGYYQRLRYEIKKEIKKDTKIIFINFIPKKDIDVIVFQVPIFHQCPF
jgi:hypothetical protein